MRLILLFIGIYFHTRVYSQNTDKAYLHIGNVKVEYIMSRVHSYDIYGDFLYSTNQTDKIANNFNPITENQKFIKTYPHYEYYTQYDEYGEEINIKKIIEDSIRVDLFLGEINKNTLLKILSNPILFRIDTNTFETNFTILIASKLSFQKIIKGEYSWLTMLKYELNLLSEHDLVILTSINVIDNNSLNWNWRNYITKFYWKIKD
ncbi:MAG: hypothetical protein KDD24_04695 [Flavobacteriales bacterium]|nr:hypothetical protein [Flavobacteriales bacterium]